MGATSRKMHPRCRGRPFGLGQLGGGGAIRTPDHVQALAIF